jgi:hypothetical protein
VVLVDAAILTDVAVAAITYAAFALEPLNGELISVTTAGTTPSMCRPKRHGWTSSCLAAAVAAVHPATKPSTARAIPAAPGYNGAGGNGTAPGGGGGGGGSYGSFGGAGGAGGAASAWFAQTIAITSGMTEITGTVGAGGTSGAATNTAHGGTGAIGSAFFYFYS